MKKWEELWNENWWLTMTCLERGVWLQLLILTEESGTINVKKVREIADKLQISMPVFLRVLNFLHENSQINIEKKPNGLISVSIPGGGQLISSQWINNNSTHRKTWTRKSMKKKDDKYVKQKFPTDDTYKNIYIYNTRKKKNKKKNKINKYNSSTSINSSTVQEKEKFSNLNINEKFEKAWNSLWEEKILHSYQDKIDVDAEGLKMKNWVAVNPPKKNYRRFIINWLNRAIGEKLCEK